jgi:lipopolysaccharide transport system ATP-binding protein
MFFQAKSMAKMKKMIDSGVTVIFVSHDTVSIKSLCHKAILLQDGAMVANDAADKVVDMYFSARVADQQLIVKNNDYKGQLLESALHEMDKHDQKRIAFSNNEEFLKRASFERIRNGKADFVNVQLLDEAGNEMQTVAYGQDVVLRMSIAVNEDIHAIGCGYHIRTKNGVSIINTNLHIEDKIIMHPVKGDRYTIDWKFKLCLMDDLYNIQCVMSIPVNVEFGEVDFCDYIPCAVQFTMQRRMKSKLYGCVHIDNIVEIEKISIV